MKSQEIANEIVKRALEIESGCSNLTAALHAVWLSVGLHLAEIMAAQNTAERNKKNE